ncbi:MAG: sigma-54-dependent Fis family transcriptional regulator [Chitinivibrionales bacterium]|nr:sigma-54-dependent Fis family transcriptional regulator [Chitinivibrionales bacterium]
MERIRVLVVDDDNHMLSSVVEILKRKGYYPDAYTNGNDALQGFCRGAYNLVISDIRMPSMSGVEVLQKVRAIDPYVPFIIMTAFGEVSVAVEAMKRGAYDFIEKGTDLLEKLEFTVQRALQHNVLLNENMLLRSELQKQWQYIGNAASIESIRELVSTIAQSRSTVLVSGESGTGKELIARSIHYLSNRQKGPFIKVNCAALPEGLIESELFGHEKGAFTGALRTRAGKFELASGGTLLMDEIGEMPITVQAKLLRVLQEREVNKVGGDEPIEVDVRIVATSNRNLAEEVKNNAFREDLYYRLNVFHIHLPPLRERSEDINLLVDHFIEKFNEENGFTVNGVTENAMKLLKQHSWPGNIRELENAIERAVVLTRTGPLDESLFRFFPSGEKQEQELFSPGLTVSESERRLILKTLEHCGQNRTRAAEMLDISIRTLRNKLHEYGISKE